MPGGPSALAPAQAGEAEEATWRSCAALAVDSPLSAEGAPGKAFWRRAKAALRSRSVAIDSLCPRVPCVPHSGPLPADVPAPFERSWQRSAEAQAEYDSFDWPLRTVAEVQRLLRCDHIAPTWLLLGEFTQAQASALETRRGVIALTVDRREPTQPGLAYVGEFNDVIFLAFWEVVMAWPSCTHQALADELCRDDKALDGRMFWGIVGFIFCYAAARARAVIVEQPSVWITVFYSVPFTRVEPAFYGDHLTKTINLFARGVDLPPFVTLERGDWSRRAFRDFADGDAADRWRSSWAHYPQMTATNAIGLSLHGACQPLVFEEEVQRFAEAWHDAGLPVPADYLNADGRPTTQAERDYQLVRGRGDGRRVQGVDPREGCSIARVVTGCSDGGSVLSVPGCPSPLDRARERASSGSSEAAGVGGRAQALGPGDLVDLRVLATGAVVLMLVSTLIQPLVFASLDGFSVLGAELPAPAARSGAPMTLVRSWTQAIGGTVAASTAFFVGRYEGGPRVAVAPLEYAPPVEAVIRTARQRRRARSAGVQLAWCTLAALAGTVVVDPAARAFAAIDSFVRPVDQMADAASLAGGSGLPTFSFGAMSAASMVKAPVIEMGASPPAWMAMQGELHAARLIVDALLEYKGEHAEYLQEWANLVKPPDLSDVPPGLLGALPTFEDQRISDYPLTAPYTPAETHWLPRRPRQPARPKHCPLSAQELLLPKCWRRLEVWLQRSLDHLRCTERGGDDCQPLRPHPLAIGQACLHEWARGVVWDFTFERSTCGVPLDFELPIESNLNLDYLATALDDYPDQRLVSFLLEGVRFEADVELHSVLVPHLLSLAKGFGSVRKELTRLEGLGWYKFFDELPFWPIYLNGQGSTPRKLEPDRWRRTTEGGGPRKETFDEEGVQAWSLNDAARAYHTPRYYAADEALSEWAAACSLLRPPMDAEGKVPKWPRELKPTPADVMRDLTVLRAAAHLMGEPVYLFGDDAKDYFNQLAMAPEAWWQLGIVFLSPAELESRLYTNGFAEQPGRLFFISERRLGFGVMPSSNIAQRFSEALLHLFRIEMDREEAEIAAKDRRPSYLEWRRRRERVQQRRGGRQQRLYFAHMYTDDPIFGVVGVARALAALRSWRSITLRAGLIMAIAEKRSLGTWALWLGLLLFGRLGLIVVPKSKLLRATAALRKTLNGDMEFCEYRMLTGLLEHLRCVNCEGRYIMHGLYEPHKPTGESRFGPNAIVRPGGFMVSQLTRWLALVGRSGGASVLAALDKRHAPGDDGAAVYTASADAATDSHVPGIGGYCHGMYWYVPIHPEWLNWLHITVLELLATGINAIVFAPYLHGAKRVVFLSDALATPYALTRQSERSPMLQLAHHALLADPQFQEIAEVAECAHLQGDCNAFSDAVSRAEWQRFFALCRVVGVTPRELAVPSRVHLLVRLVVDLARERGERVRRTPYVRRDPPIPAALLNQLDARPSGEEPTDLVEPAATPARRKTLRLRGSGDAAPQEDQGWQARWAQRMRGDAPPEPAQPAEAESKAQLAGELGAFLRRMRGEATQPEPPTIPRVEISGLTLPARPQTHAARADADSRLREAARQHAARRSASMATSPFAPALNLEVLTRLLQHADDLADYGAAYGTQRKDELAWEHWETFAELLGFDPLVSSAQTRDYPEHVSTLLATFLMYVYPKMKGRGGREWAKPRSAFSYVLAVIRIFRRWKVVMPPAKMVKAELQGLLRAFAVVYGKAALQPSRREPMLFSMLERLCSIREGARLRRGFVWSERKHECRAFRRMLSVGWRTGHRLAEMVYHPSGEIYYLTRADLTWVIGGVVVVDPTPAQLAQLKPGDCALLAPPRSKTDQFGEVHCPFPSAILFDPTKPCNAGADLRDIELEQPCRGGARASTPLFADESGHSYRHGKMDDLLHDAMLLCFGDGVARTHSWHSLRSGLACALKEAGCPPEEIQLICRWLNPESLRAYSRLGVTKFIDWVAAAEKAVVDSMQTANMPKYDLCEGLVGLHIEFGRPLSAQAQAVLDAADDAEATPTQAAAARSPRRAAPAADARNEAATEQEPPPPPDLRPLTIANCEGRRVLVPSRLWTTYTCDENDGRGWTGQVMRARARGGGATVAFLHATTARGLPYEDVELELDVLEPM